MSGWTLLSWIAVCATGILAFLRIVACEIEGAARERKRAEAAAKRAASQEGDHDDTEVVTVNAA